MMENGGEQRTEDGRARLKSKGQGRKAEYAAAAKTPAWPAFWARLRPAIAGLRRGGESCGYCRGVSGARNRDIDAPASPLAHRYPHGSAVYPAASPLAVFAGFGLRGGDGRFLFLAAL